MPRTATERRDPHATMTRHHFARVLAALLLALLVAQPGHAQEPQAQPDAEDGDGFMLNLQDAELRSLIRTVSQRTGRNFIVDPRVDATINVVSSAPVNDRELYDVFQAVLSVHGYATVEEGDVIKIVPEATGTRSSIPVGENGGSQLVTRVLAVEHVNAAQLVPVLRPLLPEASHLAAYEPTGRLIVTAAGANVERIARIIDRVDQPVDSGIDVVELEHASAQEIVRILGTLQGGEQGGGVRAAADARSNRILISGPPETRLRVRTLIANLDTPLEREGNTRVVYLKYADAEELVGLLTSITEARQEADAENGGPAGQEPVIIQADANTNSLVVTGPPDRLDGLESVVRRLDIRRAQVLVEAIIAEVSQDQAREFGVQFGADGSDGDRPSGGTSFSSGGSNIVNLIQNPAGVASGMTVAAVDEGGGTDFGVLIRALASDANNNILSTPSLMTLDNAEAEIVVGQNVPFVTGQYTGGDADGAQNPFQTIERRDVGITLQVQPQINEGDTIKMNINQEVSSIASTAQTASDVITNKRSLTTTVLVEDGQTLVLGGLIDDTVQTTNEQVPLLGDIPVLGRLFSYQSTSKVKQNLMVFLHPRILREEGLANYYTGEKYSYMRSQQQTRQEESPALVDELPLLPELDLQHDGAPTPSGQTDERTRPGAPNRR